jgi:hypothetical protein
MYLQEGLIRPGGVAYFDASMESGNYSTSEGVGRFLFAPSAIYDLLAIYLADDDLARFTKADIATVLSFRGSPDALATWNAFRFAFFSMVYELSAVLTARGGFVSKPANFRELFASYLKGKFYEQYLAEIDPGALGTAAASVFLGAPVPVKPIVDAGSKAIRGLMPRIAWRLRRPNLIKGLAAIKRSVQTGNQ